MCLKNWKRKRHPKFIQETVELWVESPQTGSKDGGDISPGPVPVPSGQKLSWEYFKAPDGRQWIVMRVTEKFFWIIPFTYYEYVIDLGFRYFEPTAENVVNQIDEAINWNRRDKMRPVFYEGKVIFHHAWTPSTTWEYEVGNNDYSYLKYNTDNE